VLPAPPADPDQGKLAQSIKNMPPTFAYALAFMIWVLFACLVWLAAGLLYFVKETSSLSRPLCFAMAATFPFVIAYQILAAPFVATILLVAWGVWKFLEPGTSTTTENPFVIGVSIGAAFLSFGLMLATSLAGFYEGWRVGWAWARGRRLREAMWERPTVRLLHRLRQRARSVFICS
jgi:hypothetical protein